MLTVPAEMAVSFLTKPYFVLLSFAERPPHVQRARARATKLFAITSEFYERPHEI